MSVRAEEPLDVLTMESQERLLDLTNHLSFAAFEPGEPGGALHAATILSQKVRTSTRTCPDCWCAK